MDILRRTRTDEVLLDMLRENCGTHFLDSGGAYGRHWQQNQRRDLENEPSSVVSFLHGEIELTHHVFGWLRERLTYDDDANRAMVVMTRFIRLSNWREGVRDHGYVAGEWVETNGETPNEMERRELFPEFFRAWKARHDEADRDECRACAGSGEVDADDHGTSWSVCRACCGRGWMRSTSVRYDERNGFTTRSPYELGGLYGEGKPLTVNVANEEHLLDQVILFLFFTMERESYVVLQIHGGADVRGGYSDPRVFSLGDRFDDALAMFDYGRGAVICTGEGPFVAQDVGEQILPGLAGSDDDHHEHYWATENGHRFERQEGCVIGGATPLDAYEKVSLDPEEHARLVSEGAEPDERGIVETDGGQANLVAKTWVRGALSYAHDDATLEDGTTIAAGTGFCPICGGRLVGAPQ
jgi:hypothetical protein